MLKKSPMTKLHDKNDAGHLVPSQIFRTTQLVPLSLPFCIMLISTINT